MSEEEKNLTEESIEMKRIKRLIKFMEDNKQPVAHAIFLQLVFMDNVLEDLQQEMQRTGTLDNFEQGAQKMVREAPALSSYNKVLQRYNQTLKSFTDMLPIGETNKAKDALLDFLEADN